MPDTHLAVTREGERYFRQMVEAGYMNLPIRQRVEWNILHDLVLREGSVPMSTFLTESQSSILGRTFSQFSEGHSGQLALEGYGKTLHSLIEQKYVRAFKNVPLKEKSDGKV